MIMLPISLRYVLIGVAAIVEGPVLMVACGFLLSQGALTLAPLFTALVLGDLVGDIIWYYIGYFFADPFIARHGHFFSVTPELMDRAKKLFSRYHTNILLISKANCKYKIKMKSTEIKP